MTDMKLLIYVGGAVGGIMIFFFGWVIRLTNTQKNETIKNVKENAVIKIELMEHRVKIANLASNMSSIGNTVDKIQNDLNDLKMLTRENNLLMNSFKSLMQDVIKK